MKTYNGYKKMMRGKKGFAALTDFAIATSIFFIIFAYGISLWSSFNVTLESQKEFNEMLTKSYHISDLLVKTKGSPSAWERNPESAATIGLATRTLDLSETKVNAFTSILYNNSTVQSLEEY